MRSEKSSEYAKNRSRTWVCIVYPESAPADWRDRLDETHVCWCESPLHDKDVDAAAEGENKLKKAHWHLLFVFESVKSPEQVKELTDSINATMPIRCQSVKGTVRYMAHLDNPEKYQYPVAEIRGHGGFDVGENLKPSVTERYDCIKEMIAWIVENDVIEFEDLLLYAMYNRYDDWFPLLCDNSAYIMTGLLKSRRGRKSDEEIAKRYM